MNETNPEILLTQDAEWVPGSEVEEEDDDDFEANHEADDDDEESSDPDIDLMPFLSKQAQSGQQRESRKAQIEEKTSSEMKPRNRRKRKRNQIESDDERDFRNTNRNKRHRSGRSEIRQSGPGGWDCRACTLRNESRSTKCEVCDAPKPSQSLGVVDYFGSASTARQRKQPLKDTKRKKKWSKSNPYIKFSEYNRNGSRGKSTVESIVGDDILSKFDVIASPKSNSSTSCSIIVPEQNRLDRKGSIPGNTVVNGLDEIEETTDIEKEKCRKRVWRQRGSRDEQYDDISEWDTDIDLKPKPKVKYRQRMQRLNLLSPR